MQRKLDPPTGEGPFAVRDGYVEHPYLKSAILEEREFQLRVAERALRENTLVVVPTGLGKTLIAVLVAAELLRQKRGTVLLLAPTRPLALQHFETMKRMLRDEGLIHVFTGKVTPAQRTDLWGRGILIVATPQTVRNDLATNRYDLGGLGLLVFDEAHRAVGDYAYAELGARLRLENPRCRVLGLTASPGAKRDRLAEVRRNLGVTALEMRDAASADVAPYVHAVPLEARFVDLGPTLRRVTRPFHDLKAEKEEKLRALGLVRGNRRWGLGKAELVQILQEAGRRRFYAALHPAALAHYAKLALDYGEIYGLDALARYLNRLEAKPDLKRNEKSFLHHPKTQEARVLLAKGWEEPHPKVPLMLGILGQEAQRRPDFIAIVFTQYRDSVPGLLAALRSADLAAERFVGQADRAGEQGLDQDQQRSVLERFGRREFRVLVSTSIGEEGIDVPQVDLVLFYDAVPSEIRSIQRRGRTGRTVPGRVIVLVAKDTADEGAYKASLKREDRMRRLVRRYA